MRDYIKRICDDELELKLEAFGAVSLETACEMAEGLSKISGCDLCIS